MDSKGHDEPCMEARGEQELGFAEREAEQGFRSSDFEWDSLPLLLSQTNAKGRSWVSLML